MGVALGCAALLVAAGLAMGLPVLIVCGLVLAGISLVIARFTRERQ